MLLLSLKNLYYNYHISKIFIFLFIISFISNQIFITHFLLLLDPIIIHSQSVLYNQQNSYDKYFAIMKYFYIHIKIILDHCLMKDLSYILSLMIKLYFFDIFLPTLLSHLFHPFIHIYYIEVT
jgi:hypothetical protein